MAACRKMVFCNKNKGMVMSFEIGNEVTYQKRTMVVQFVSGDEVTCVYTVDKIHHSIVLNSELLELKKQPDPDQPLPKKRKRTSSF